MRLRIPGEMRAVRDSAAGQPTGALVPVAGTPYDFATSGGAALGQMALDDSFVDLQQELLDSGPSAELSDPANGFGLRLTALSPTIKTMRVVAPADGDFVTIDPQFNYDDPLGREWGKDTTRDGRAAAGADDPVEGAAGDLLALGCGLDVVWRAQGEASGFDPSQARLVEWMRTLELVCDRLRRALGTALGVRGRH